MRQVLINNIAKPIDIENLEEELRKAVNLLEEKEAKDFRDYTEFLKTLDKNVRDYEPRYALNAGPDGLDIYRRIIEKVDNFLKPDAAMMLEISYAQGRAVKEMLEKTALFTQIKIEKDFSGNDRIAIAKKQAILN